MAGRTGRGHPEALGGHRRNKIYGRLDCRGAQRWIAKGHYVAQRVFFADEADGDRGRLPALRRAACPQRYREWKADPEAFAARHRSKPPKPVRSRS